MGASVGIWQIIIVVFFVAIQIIPFWKIFPRAGWSSWLSLLMVIPLVNLVLLYVLAFKAWPGDDVSRTFE